MNMNVNMNINVNMNVNMNKKLEATAAQFSIRGLWRLWGWRRERVFDDNDSEGRLLALYKLHAARFFLYIISLPPPTAPIMLGSSTHVHTASLTCHLTVGRLWSKKVVSRSHVGLRKWEKTNLPLPKDEFSPNVRWSHMGWFGSGWECFCHHFTLRGLFLINTPIQNYAYQKHASLSLVTVVRTSYKSNLASVY